MRWVYGILLWKYSFGKERVEHGKIEKVASWT